MKLLLIDANSIINRAYHALKYARLTDASGNDTGAVFGFFNILLRHLRTKKGTPTHIVAAFDLKAPTFRHEVYPEYKGKRPPQDEALTRQFPIVKQILKGLGITVVEQKGLEADDIIGSIAKKHWCSCDIVTGDRDMLQLVDKYIRVIFSESKQDVIYDIDNIVELYGLTPQGVIEYKALRGDTSDNIIGVPGIGEKTAKELINQYGDIDNLYAHIDEIKGAKREKLIQGRESAYFSRMLATIKTDAELGITLEQTQIKEPLPKEGYELMMSANFGSKILDGFYPDGVPDSLISSQSVLQQQQLTELAQFEELCYFAEKTGELVIVTEGNTVHFLTDNVEYMALLYAEDFFTPYLEEESVWLAIKKVLTDNKINKICFDLKALFYRVGYAFLADDLMLMSYAIDAGRVFDSSKELASFYGGYGDNLAENAKKVYAILKQKMKDLNVEQVYSKIELPLIPVLYSMEQEGFCIDKVVLEELKQQYSNRCQQYEQNIYSLCGHPFNINSPKQLGEVLFDELKLPSQGTKRSTGADILEKLRFFHPIIDLILDYRTLKKLLSTYIIAYENLLDSNGKVHTIFKQALTTTGRLSSVEPNLQNIPVRKAEGRELRKMFVASEGNMLVAADYSQIELRLLAHYSMDENLIYAYNNGLDIHKDTASKIFNVPLSEVTPQMRASAKTINFGIIYGMSAFGLSESLGISIQQAKLFQERYFESYPRIAQYLDGSVENAKKNGYTSTIFGRIRFIPELDSTNKNIIQQGERMAKNMPLQGSSADIIKLAMTNVYNALNNKGLRAKLILQIHDELIVDCPIDEVQQVKDILVNEMQDVAKLNVPLVADCGIGKNWLEAKA